MTEFLGREALNGFAIADVPCQGLNDEGHSCESLLAIDDQQGRLTRNLIKAFLDIDYGAYKVGEDLIVGACSQNVLPKLSALRLCP